MLIRSIHEHNLFWQAIAAIENAMLDITGKAYGVPVSAAQATVHTFVAASG
eukprot:SAG11_NODE_5884_length_1441_cov_1.404620_2_plen_51_part_00